MVFIPGLGEEMDNWDRVVPSIARCARIVRYDRPGIGFKLRHTGKNLLDFHLAFHLGELVARNPEATYRIVSKDGGFDALIADLQARGLAVERLRVEPLPTEATEVILHRNQT